jgi:hypothetical protein
MRNSFLWQPWPGPRAPASARDETEFLRALHDNAKSTTRKRRMQRDDITLLMDAFRCGLTFDELKHFAVGVSPARLLCAYDVLERERLAVLASWAEVLQDPTVHVIAEHTESIDRLLPAPTGHILSAINDGARNGELALLIRRVNASIQRVHGEALVLEEEMVRAPTRSDAADAGLLLYDPFQPSLWNHPFYLAPRVGSLSPSRVADLLGERHADVPQPRELLNQFLPPRRRGDRA